MSHRLAIRLLVATGIVAASVAGPTSAMAGTQDESAPTPEQRAAALVAQMTLDEKISQLHTTGVGAGGIARLVPGIPRLGIPDLRISNGPAGVGTGSVSTQPNATALPAPVSLAASFDPALAHEYGVVEGRETTDVGHNLLEAPDVNIVRVPQSGRAFENYGEDPYLAGQLAVADIDGIQSQGVLSEVKHYTANDQETNRSTINEVIDERTLREIDLPAFEDAVKNANVAAVMCAYPSVNGSFMCENKHLLADVLRGDWGFNGFVQSDANATHDAVASAEAGQDLELRDNGPYDQVIKQAILDGAVSIDTIDTLIERRLATEIRFGLFDHPATTSPIDAAAGGAVARTAAEQGSVLLKNDHSTLPLDAGALHSIAVVGPYAGAAYTGGGGSAHVNPLYTVSPVAGIQSRVGSGVTVNYAPGVDSGPPPAVPSSALTPPGQPSVHGLLGEYFANADLSGTPAFTQVDPQIDVNYGAGAPAGLPTDHFSIRWTGELAAPTTGEYELASTSDDGSRVYVDGNLVVNNWGNHGSQLVTAAVPLSAGQHSLRVEYYDNTGNASVTLGWIPPGASQAIQQAVDAAKASDVAVVMVGDVEAEGKDRANLTLPGLQDELVSEVAAANPNTIVVVKSGAPVLMPWLDQVPSVLEAWYPGEEDGNAVAALLFGDVNPSGKLPVTFPRSDSQTPASTPDRWPGVNGTVQYSEGLDVGYRWYDANDLDPLFPFGYGLSYTTFAFSHLVVEPGPLPVGGEATVTVDVTNTGSRAGAEVAQLYIGDPASSGEPPKQLKGFEKVELAPGQTKQVHFTLDARDLAYWDAAANGWVSPAGMYTVMVGDSSRDLPLSAHLPLARTLYPR